MTQVNLDIVSSYSGKGVKSAQSDLASLNRSIKKVGAAFGVSLSAARLASFTSSAVKAAEADMKAQRLLANQIRNVGLEFAAANSEAYIAGLQKQQQILDDELRPAYIKFLRLTKDVNQSQEMMDLAFNTAAGAGIDYSQAVDIIAKAYQGNAKGLKALNLGLTQTQLQAMTAGQVFELMAQKFDNAGKQMVSPMQSITIAFADFKEQWGTAYSEGFLSGTAATNVEELTTQLKGLTPVASGIGRILGYAALGISKIGEGAAWVAGKISGKNGAIAPSLVPKNSVQITKQIFKELEKNNKQSIYNNQQMLKQQKAITAQQQKSVALQKLSNLLRQAQKVFDNEAITLAAAAQGKLTDEERARLKLKQDIYDLEQAIATENVTAATEIAKTLVSDAQYLGQITGFLTGIQGVTNPFADWLKSLKDILATLGAVVQAIPFMSSAILPGGFDPRYAQGKSPADMYPGALSLSYGSSESDISSARYQAMADYYAQQTSASVNIQINPAVAGLINVIQDTSASGTSPTVSRINTSYIA